MNHSSRGTIRRILIFGLQVGALVLGLSCACWVSALEIHAMALFKGKAVFDIDGKRRTLKVGGDPKDGVRLISSNSERAVIEVDGEQQEIKLNRKVSTRYRRQAPAKSFKLYPGENGHYFVDGLINGHSVPFLVDTGASTIAINRHLAKKMGLLYRVDGTRGLVETASGQVAAYFLDFKEVTVRSITLKNVRGVVVDSDYPRVALLGQSFLNRLDLRRDNIVMELRER